jgi:hypothetical protein
VSFDTCWNCGEPGHIASSCHLPPPAAPKPGPPPRWQPPQARPQDIQAAINQAGAALCRELLAARRTVAP